MAKKRRKPRSHAAIVTIHRAADMTKPGRRQIATWLKRTAASLIKEGDKYARRFTARYYYR